MNMRAWAMVPAMLAMLVGVAVAQNNNMPAPNLPDALKGFAGQLEGEVVAKWENGFTLRVTAVPNVWPRNAAQNPQAAIGQTLLINVNWENDGGRWRAVPQQQAWVRLIKAGDHVKVDVKNAEGERLHIMELNQDQRAAVAAAANANNNHAGGNNGGNANAMPAPQIPDGLKGFAGVLEGKVVAKWENGFTMQVTRIYRTWRHSTATNPQAAIGQTLLINVGWENRRPVENHVKFIKFLCEIGDTVRVDVKNDEGERLHIMELNRDQRAALERAIRNAANNR